MLKNTLINIKILRLVHSNTWMNADRSEGIIPEKKQKNARENAQKH